MSIINVISYYACIGIVIEMIGASFLPSNTNDGKIYRYVKIKKECNRW